MAATAVAVAPHQDGAGEGGPGSPICVGHSSAAVPATARASDHEEYRRSPYDGRVYTFATLVKACSKQHSTAECWAYWEQTMVPLKPGECPEPMWTEEVWDEEWPAELEALGASKGVKYEKDSPGGSDAQILAILNEGAAKGDAGSLKMLEDLGHEYDPNSALAVQERAGTRSCLAALGGAEKIFGNKPLQNLDRNERRKLEFLIGLPPDEREQWAAAFCREITDDLFESGAEGNKQKIIAYEEGVAKQFLQSLHGLSNDVYLTDEDRAAFPKEKLPPPSMPNPVSRDVEGLPSASSMTGSGMSTESAMPGSMAREDGSVPRPVMSAVAKQVAKDSGIPEGLGEIALVCRSVHEALDKNAGPEKERLIRAVLRVPANLGVALDLLGGWMKCYEIEKVDRALERFLVPLVRQPGIVVGLRIKALGLRTVCKSKMGCYQDALEAMLESERVTVGSAWNLFPDALNYLRTLYCNMGGCYLKLQQSDDALRCFHRSMRAGACRGDPPNDSDMHNIGMLLYMRRDATEDELLQARELLELCCELHEENEQWAYAVRAKRVINLGECCVFLADKRQSLGKHELYVPDIEHALVHFRKAHSMLVEIRGPIDYLSGTLAGTEMADCLMRLRRFEEVKPVLVDVLRSIASQHCYWGIREPGAAPPVLSTAHVSLHQAMEAHKETDDRKGLELYLEAVVDTAMAAVRRSIAQPHVDRFVGHASALALACGTPRGNAAARVLAGCGDAARSGIFGEDGSYSWEEVSEIIGIESFRPSAFLDYCEVDGGVMKHAATIRADATIPDDGSSAYTPATSVSKNAGASGEKLASTNASSARKGVWEAWKEGTLGAGGGDSGGIFEGLRRNPEDFKCYSFPELVRACRQCFSRAEVESFWLRECVPVFPGEDVRAKPILPLSMQRLLEEGDPETIERLRKELAQGRDPEIVARLRGSCPEASVSFGLLPEAGGGATVNSVMLPAVEEIFESVSSEDED